MKMNELSLKPINDLLGESFYIPAYQRGYRWTDRQVKDLLDDVYEFCNKEVSKNEFYCLQPVVIKKRGDQWELVDGQQRLTTIFLILKYFNDRLAEKFQKQLYSIEYETRPNSKAYLTSLDESEKNQNIDFFHIHQSFNVMQDWFEDKEHRINDIESVFLNKVKVIWYEIKENINPIDVFARLNIGKIQLTNSELIKALYLRASNFDNDSQKKLLQIKIAQEWDEIETSLQADDLWYFISNEDNNANRIEFILKLIADDLNSDQTLKRDPNYTFLIFNTHFSSEDSSLSKEWNTVKRYFMTIREWFSDRYLYHLIGFLVDQKISIAEIFKMANGSSTKREFRMKLRAKVFRNLLSGDLLIDYTKLNDQIAGLIDSLDYDRQTTKSKIKSVLLLFNIATLVVNNSSNTRFQFDSYKKEDWNIEHVRSVASDKPEGKDRQKLWLKSVIEYCTGEKDQEEWNAKVLEVEDADEREICIDSLSILNESTFDSAAFDELYERSVKHFDSDGLQDVDGSIGNLTLLDANTNKSYKNAVFPIKRKRILSLDKTGRFVPLCTKNLFLKYYSKKINNMMVWDSQDIESYRKEIISTLVGFFMAEAENI